MTVNKFNQKRLKLDHLHIYVHLETSPVQTVISGVEYASQVSGYLRNKS